MQQTPRLQLQIREKNSPPQIALVLATSSETATAMRTTITKAASTTAGIAVRELPFELTPLFNNEQSYGVIDRNSTRYTDKMA